MIRRTTGSTSGVIIELHPVMKELYVGYHVREHSIEFKIHLYDVVENNEAND